MASISSLVSIRTGSNSRRPSRVRLRMADIRRSILAIDDLMNPSASVKSCESCLSLPSSTGSLSPEVAATGEAETSARASAAIRLKMSVRNSSSSLVNIMGFTSELEELRTDIFRRIAALARAEVSASPVAATSGESEPVLEGKDRQLSQDFTEALGFIKSSIAKMDRLISAILNLTREGRREFEPVRIDTNELIEAIVTTMAHQAAEADAEI